MRASVACHNVYVGQKPAKAQANLARLAEDLDFPLGILLSEAKNLDNIHVPRYREHRAATRHPDAHDCIILVRDDVRVIDEGFEIAEGSEWVWHEGHHHPSRVFPWVAVEGMVLVAVHRVPMGPRPYIDQNRLAWNKEHACIAKLVEDLKVRSPGSVICLGGDWNAAWNEMPMYTWSLQSLAHHLGADAGIKHIDGFMVVGGKVQQVKKWDDRYGSDAHEPVSAVVTAA